MPDENKFAKLHEIGYVIPITCGLCLHGPAKGDVWGECGKHRYNHQKHANPIGGRGVSIHVSGTCSKPEADPKKTWRLGAYIEFLEKA